MATDAILAAGLVSTSSARYHSRFACCRDPNEKITVVADLSSRGLLHGSMAYAARLALAAMWRWEPPRRYRQVGRRPSSLSAGVPDALASQRRRLRREAVPVGPLFVAPSVEAVSRFCQPTDTVVQEPLVRR